MGPASAVYLQTQLEDEVTDVINSHLASVAGKIQQTRKGRVWSIWINDRPIYISLEQTAKVLWDCEDELSQLKLLPEDVPSRIALSAGCNTPDDYAILQNLTEELAAI